MLWAFYQGLRREKATAEPGALERQDFTLIIALTRIGRDDTAEGIRKARYCHDDGNLRGQEADAVLLLPEGSLCLWRDP